MNRPAVISEDSCATQYWESARKRALELPRCDECGDFFFPPRGWCPHCYGRRIAWERVTGKGTVVSFSRLYMEPFRGYADKLPYVVATIRLAEGPQLMANVINSDLASVKIGAPVRIVFEDRGEGCVVPQFVVVEDKE